MLKTVTLFAALAAMAVAWLLGLPITPLLAGIRRLRTACEEPVAAPGAQTKKLPPLLGGLLVWLGVGAGFVGAALLAEMRLGREGYIRGGRMAVTLLGCALLFGLIGLVRDVAVVKKNGLPGRGVRVVLCLAQLGAGAALLAQLYLNGAKSTVVRLPGVGWVQLGMWYYPLALGLIWLAVNAVRRTQEPDGLAAGTGFVIALGMMMLSMLLLELDVPGDRFICALFAAAIAGGCVGFAFWSLYPARLRLGSAGSQFLGGGLVAAAFALGRPELLVFMLLPCWCGQAYAALHAVSGGRLCRAGTLHGALAARGWKPHALLGLWCGLACTGVLAAVLSVFLYG